MEAFFHPFQTISFRVKMRWRGEKKVFKMKGREKVYIEVTGRLEVRHNPKYGKGALRFFFLFSSVEVVHQNFENFLKWKKLEVLTKGKELEKKKINFQNAPPIYLTIPSHFEICFFKAHHHVHWKCGYLIGHWLKGPCTQPSS